MKTKQKQIEIDFFDVGILPVITFSKEADFKKYAQKRGLIFKCCDSVRTTYYSAAGGSPMIVLKYIEMGATK